MLARIACLWIFVLTPLVAVATAPSPWVEVRSDHFTVLTDASEKDGRRIVDQFERMRWMFQTLFPKTNVDPMNPIVVLAAKNGKSFESLEPAVYLAKGQMKLSGLFLNASDKNDVLLRLDAEFEHPYASIYHEYTHLQFKDDREWMPLWLNEGLAEFMQNTEFRNKDVLLGEPSADDILYLRQNKTIPLPVLFKVDTNSPYYHEEQKGSVFYAESWALTHYLFVTDKTKGTDRVGDYMKLLMRREDPLVAAQKAFGDLKILQKELDRYIYAGNYGQFILSSAAAPIDESGYKVRTLTQPEADAARAEVLAYVNRTDEAEALLASVLKADPKNAKAHEVEGHIHFQAGKREAALAEYAQAVQLGSKSYLAHYYFASLSMEMGKKGKQIEASLRTCIQLNPRFAPGLDALASLIALQHGNLDEAHGWNVQAIQLDPGKLMYRVNAANVMAMQGKYDPAKTVLQTALKLARNNAETAMVQARISEIERTQAASAQGEVTFADGNTPTPQDLVVVSTPPKHPTVTTPGPRHPFSGMIRGVECSFPSVIEFRVEGLKKKINVYNNNLFKIDLSALGFNPPADMNPCKDFEGKKARVQYVDSTDKSVDGQVQEVVLMK
jgi:tetratricopeptide (TPR) repeat protein